MKSYAKDAHDRIRETYNAETADAMDPPTGIELGRPALVKMRDELDAFLASNRGRG